MNKTLTDLAHEIYAAAQTAPGEGIEDAAARIEALLAAQQSKPRDAIERSKRILTLVDDYHEKPTRDTRSALRVALLDEFQPEPRAEVTDDDKIDAGRYRWLRDYGFKYADVSLGASDGGNVVEFKPRFHIPEPAGMEYDDGEWNVDDIDVAIDAARAAGAGR
jgi:hypothetical protein